MCMYKCKESWLIKEKNNQVSNYMWQIIRYYKEGWRISALERNMLLYFVPQLDKNFFIKF